MNKINFVSAHVVSEVIEDSLDLLIMWCDERYAYDDRPYEQIPCDEVAANYLATIACCLQVAVNAHDYRTLCNRYAQGLVEEYQHELDNTKEEIEMTQELDRFAEDLEEDYEDELEAGRARDEQRNEDVLKRPSDAELALDREHAEEVDEERFHAGENYIDECHHCGFVFEVQDLIPVERHCGVVYFCEGCFEEEYHAGLE